MHLVIVARAAKVNNQRGPGQLFIGRHIRHGGLVYEKRIVGGMRIMAGHAFTFQNRLVFGLGPRLASNRVGVAFPAQRLHRRF